MILGWLLVACVFAACAFFLWRLPRKKSLRWKFVARLPAGILFCVAVLMLLACSFAELMCGRYEYSPVSSPNGLLAAQVIQVDCGAGDHFHSHVLVSRSGNTITRFFNPWNSAVVFKVGDDGLLVDLTWKDAQTLAIRYPSDSHYHSEFLCERQWRDVRIECVQYLPNYNAPRKERPPVHRGVW
jgi:hypothetical protein